MTARTRTKTRLRKGQTDNYSPVNAAKFWNRRLISTSPLAAVLTYNAPETINELYDRWERMAVGAVVGRSLRRTHAVDLGAGTGRISLLLAERGAHVISVDAASLMLAHLMRSARAKKLHKAISPIVASATRLPLDDASADLVTCCGLLEHLPWAARNAAIREAFRILSPSGKMVVVVNNTESIFLKNRYPMTGQRADGYFVGLVGLPWLVSAAKRVGWTARVRAANPWYACASGLTYCNDRSKLLHSTLKSVFSRLPELDLQVDLSSSPAAALATHYIIEVTRR